MCIIAVSKKGVKQPTLEQLKTMFKNNPDGAGYMTVRNGKVEIHKGFMDCKTFIRNVKEEHFTANDPVVYHFRISTQAGVNAKMTHPFPLTSKLETCEKLDLRCSVGIAHNGIITLTSDPKEKRYSDTAFFITEFMTRLIREPRDIKDPYVNIAIHELTNSKWALMDETGNIETVGYFYDEDGLLFSNLTYLKGTYISTGKSKYLTDYYDRGSYDDYLDGYYGGSKYYYSDYGKNYGLTQKSVITGDDDDDVTTTAVSAETARNTPPFDM